MTLLIKLFFEICLLKANPQDIPSSRILTITTVVLYAILGLLVSSIELAPAKALFSSLIDTALLVALGIVSLWIIGKPERNAQTIAALTGSGAILQFIAWPVLFWLSQAGETESAILMIPRLGLLLLVIWNVIIIAHILRHALSVSLPVTIGISVLYTYFTIRIASILFVAAG